MSKYDYFWFGFISIIGVVALIVLAIPTIVLLFFLGISLMTSIFLIILVSFLLMLSFIVIGMISYKIDHQNILNLSETDSKYKEVI